MADRWGRKTITGWDQPLPWGDGTDGDDAAPVVTAAPGDESSRRSGRPALVDVPTASAAGDHLAEPPPAGSRISSATAPKGRGSSGPIAQPDSSRRSRAGRTASLTPEQRSLRSRMAAYRLHATHDPKETTRKARDAFAARFEREVDPDGLLAPAERTRRAEAARRAYFTGLALRSSQVRRRRKR